LKLLVILVLLFPALGQTVMFQPVSLTVSNSLLGKGRDVGIWVVTVDLPPGTTRTRMQVLMSAPQLKALPNRVAQAVLSRKAARDPRSIMVDLGQVLLGLSGPALGAVGVTSGSRGYTYAGLAAGALQAAILLMRRQAPDAGAITPADLLPDVVGASGSWYVVASLMHGADTIGPVPISDGLAVLRRPEMRR